MWCDSTAVKVTAEEAHRILGQRFNLEMDIKQPGPVLEAKPKSTRSKKLATDSIRTRSLSSNPMASPSVAHMRSAGPQPLDLRSESQTNVTATGKDAAPQGIMIVAILP
jgi:hypothetical protein